MDQTETETKPEGADPAARTRDFFHRSFLAIDLAEPLPIVDPALSLEEAEARIGSRGLSLVVSAETESDFDYFTRKHLEGAADISGAVRPVAAGQTIASDATLMTAIQALDDHPDGCFVTALGTPVGSLIRSDLHKPPARMWTFGLLTIIESFLSNSLEEYHPDGSWQEHISESRLRKALELRKLRQKIGQNVTLEQCLQFGDKAQLFIRDPDSRADARFESARQAKKTIGAAEGLRNALAHSQDYVEDCWEVLAELSRRIDRIVMRIQ